MLERDAGPAGWADVSGKLCAIDGWELFEGDAESPHEGWGWLRFANQRLRPPRRLPVMLHIHGEDAMVRHERVRFMGTYCADVGWEFRLESRCRLRSAACTEAYRRRCVGDETTAPDWTGGWCAHRDSARAHPIGQGQFGRPHSSAACPRDRHGDQPN